VRSRGAQQRRRLAAQPFAQPDAPSAVQPAQGWPVGSDDDQFTAHVDQALQIIREFPEPQLVREVPQVVTLPKDRPHVGIRR
jgi:hypothetical protein